MAIPKNRNIKAVVAALSIAGFGLAQTITAQADSGVPDQTIELGMLECTVKPETRKNYILRSTAQVDCVFKSTKGETEAYYGETGIKLGVDLSVRENDKLRFIVLGSHRKGEQRPAFALKGKYVGPSAAASVTYGVGVAALIGGSKRKISLEPIGVETLRGLGISAGLGYLNLEPTDAS